MTKRPKANKPGMGLKNIQILGQQAHSSLREQIFYHSYPLTQVLTLKIISWIETLAILERKMFLLNIESA